MIAYVILGMIAFIGLAYVVLYNGLVSRRNMVRNGLSTIDVMLKKRHDLIPNLITTVKGFAAHESEIFERVTSLRNQATAVNVTDAARFEAERQLTPQIGRILAIAESYPDLKSSEQFLNLQRNLTETEEQLSASRRSYNAAVLELNNAVESFPSNIIASQFGFECGEFFEVESAAREVVKVDFN